MLDLTVVTFTEGKRNDWLKRCIKSVATDLPKNAFHQVIKAQGISNYAKQRIEALQLARYVCIVDDDDIVVNNAIINCYNALLDSGSGLAFTDEALVTEDGTIIEERVGCRSYEDLESKPFLIHHLVMIDTTKITDDVSFILGFHKGVDHNINRAAIKNSGAIHVPIIGYHWTQHKNSLSSRPTYYSPPLLIINNTGLIPQFDKII